MTEEEVITEVWNHPKAHNKADFFDGPVGKLCQLIVEKIGDFDEFKRGQASMLVAHMITRGCNWLTLGKQRIYMNIGQFTMGGGHFQIGTKGYYFSPRCDGLYPEGQVPRIEGANEEFEQKVTSALKKMRYGGPALKSIRPYNENQRGFENLEAIIPSPEGGDDLRRVIGYAHKTDKERADIVEEFVTEMFYRWKHRDIFNARIAGVMAWAAKMVENEENVSVVGGEISYPRFDKSEIKSATYYAVISMLGENLAPKPIRISLHSERQLSIMLKKHRKALEKFKAGGGAEQSRTCHPIVAAAIRAQAEKYGEGILEEIETLLTGKYPRDNNPRKRGISSFRMENGELRAIVTLVNKVRFKNDRLVANEIRTLPVSMLSSMPGKSVKVVIDHPYVEDLVIRKVSITNEGLVVRIEPKPEPLERVIADLKAIIGKSKG